jgi:hypothetical protein
MQQAGAAPRQSGDKNRPVDVFAQNVWTALLFSFELQQIGKAAQHIPFRRIVAEQTEIGLCFTAFEQQAQRRNKRWIPEFATSAAALRSGEEAARIQRRVSDPYRAGEPIQRLKKAVWSWQGHFVVPAWHRGSA